MQIISPFQDFYDQAPVLYGFAPSPEPVWRRTDLLHLKGYYYQAQADKERFAYSSEAKKINYYTLDDREEYILRNLKHYVFIDHAYEHVINRINSLVTNLNTAYYQAVYIPGYKKTYGIVICDKIYYFLLIIEGNPLYGNARETTCFFNKNFPLQKHGHHNLRAEDILTTDLNLARNDQVDIQFICQVGSPVFIVDVNNVYNEIPCLSNFGFDKYLDINETYHKIEEYLRLAMSAPPKLETLPKIGLRY